MGLTVTQLATPSVVRIHLCPQRFDRSKCGILVQVSAEASLLDYAERSRECQVCEANAEIAQLIEHEPSKLGVAGLNPVFRSQKQPRRKSGLFFLYKPLKVYFHKGNTKKTTRVAKQQVVSVKATPRSEGMGE